MENCILIEDFIEDVVIEAQKRSGLERICIDWIGEFYPDFFEDAVEMCIINTAIIEGRPDLIREMM